MTEKPDPQTAARSILGAAQILQCVFDLPADSSNSQSKETRGAAWDLILTNKKVAGEGAQWGPALV